MPSLESRTYTIQAVATANGREYREGYELIDQRDLEVRYLYRPATADVQGIDVNVVPGLRRRLRDGRSATRCPRASRSWATR